MSAAYTLCVRTTVKSHKTSKDEVIQFKRTIDFVPFEGLTLRLTNDAFDDTMDIVLSDIIYDNEDRVFIVELEDTELLDSCREPDRIECVVTAARMAECIDKYKTFGWESV
jgi:hypothetical protein